MSDIEQPDREAAAMAKLRANVKSGVVTLRGEVEAAVAEYDVLRVQLDDLRDLAYNRAPKIAADECERQKAALRADLAALKREYEIKCAEMASLRTACDAASQAIKAVEAENAALREILRDVWNQFAIEKPDGSKWAGGLSTLEAVDAALHGESEVKNG